MRGRKADHAVVCSRASFLKKRGVLQSKIMWWGRGQGDSSRVEFKIMLGYKVISKSKYENNHVIFSYSFTFDTF